MSTINRQQNKLEQMLGKLSLSKKEVAVFLKLLNLGKATAAEVARGSRDIARTSVYDVLNSLVGQGLASSFIEDDKKYFQVQDIEHIVDSIETQKRELADKQDYLRSVSDLFKQMKSGSAYTPTVRFFEGEKGILAIHREILKNRKEVLAIGNMAAIAKTFPRILIEDNLKEFKTHRVPMRTLFIKNREAERYIKIAVYENRYFKWLPENVQLDTDTFIWEGHVAILDYTEHLSGVVIDNPAISSTFTAWFNMMWDSVKELAKPKLQ